MAQPSSSHHDRHRSSERSTRHRHHRTISSTTLLLVLSLVLAVLAIMLSLPSGGLGSSGQKEDAANSGILSYLSPKRTQQLIARESAVAIREAEVARREAEMLAGAPGGVIPAAPTPILCPICPTNTIETVFAPAQTVIKEVIKEESLTPPGWTGARAEEILDRELKITERERDISRREESVNRREHDASRRESWIMEQLIALGNDNPQVVEEEYYYEQPGSKRKAAKFRELPQYIVEEVIEPEIKTVIQTETVTVPPPEKTRRVAFPTPVLQSTQTPTSAPIPKTTAVEIITEEMVDEEDMLEEEYDERMGSKRGMRSSPRRPPNRWFGSW